MSDAEKNIKIVDSIRQIVKQFGTIDIDENIEIDCNLQEVYDLGSVDIIQMILKIEQLFNIEFYEEFLTFDNIRSIESLAATVEKIKVYDFDNTK